MAYNNKAILRTGNDPVPQYYNPTSDVYEVAQGNNGATNVNIQTYPGLTDFATGAVTVSSSSIELKSGSSALANRKQMIVYPPDAGTIYWGKSGVTSANGAPLKSTDQPLIFDFSPNNPVSIYAVNDGTNRTVKVVEML